MAERRFDEKSQKVTDAVGDDRLFLLDSEDKATVLVDDVPTLVPKVKTKKVSEFDFGGGGDQILFAREILVEASATVVAGKVYKTYAAALAYLEGLGSASAPSADDPVNIQLPAGLFTEAIRVIPHVYITGRGTVLTGVLSTDILYNYYGDEGALSVRSYIKGCTVKSLDMSNDKKISLEWGVGVSYSIGSEIYYDVAEDERHFYRSLQNLNVGNIPSATLGVSWELIDDEMGMPMLFFEQCYFDVDTFLKGTDYPSLIVARNSSFYDGDFTGKALMYTYDSMILGGSYPAYAAVMHIDSLKAENCEIYGGTLNGGKFVNCVTRDDMPDGVTTGAGQYTYIGGELAVDAFNLDSVLNTFNNCFIINVGFVYGSTISKLYARFHHCSFVDCTLSYPVSVTFNGYLYLTACSGRLIIKDTIHTNLQKYYYGCVYDNRTSGLTAAEMQAAIDELAGMIVDPVFDIVPRAAGHVSALLPSDEDINPDYNVCLDPLAFGDHSFPVFGKQGVSVFGHSNILFDKGLNMGNLNIAGGEILVGYISLITPSPRSVTVRFRGDRSALLPDTYLLYRPYSSIGYTYMKKILSNGGAQSDPVSPADFITDIVIEDNETSFTTLVKLKQFVHYDPGAAASASTVGLYRTQGTGNSADGNFSNVRGRWSDVKGMYASADGEGCFATGMGSAAEGFSCFAGHEIVFTDDYSIALNVLTLNGAAAFAYDLVYGKQLKVTVLGTDVAGNILAYSTFAFNVTTTYKTATSVELLYADDIAGAGFYTDVTALNHVIGVFVGMYESAEEEDAAEGFMFAGGVGSISRGILSDAEGLLCEASGKMSRALGDSSVTHEDAYASVAEGIHARADYAGERVLGAGSEEFVGDRQSFEVNLKGVSTDETYGVALQTSYSFFGALTESELLMPDYTVWRFSIEAVMLGTDGNSFGQTITGICKSVTGLYTVLEDITYAAAHKSDPGLDAEVIVECSETEGVLRIKGRTSDAAHPAHWMANVRVVQISRVPV